MTNYTHGHEAEKVAAAWLKKRKYKILDINWRRPRAEIDIVAQKKHGPITFVEVKYRVNSLQGTGLDYITERKILQMSFAAELWVSEHRHVGELTLAALEVTGSDYIVTQFIEELL